MKLKRKIGLITVLLILTACGQSDEMDSVGSVNGDELSAAYYEMHLNMMVQQYRMEAGVDLREAEYAEWLKQVEDESFDYMVTGKLMRQEAQRQAITVDQAQIDAELEELKTQTAKMGGFPLYLETLSITEDFLVEDLVTLNLYQQLCDPLLAEITVDEEEIGAYDSELNRTQYFSQNNGVEMFHILMSDEDEASQVWQRAKDGENFSQLAAEFGSDGTASTGGYVGIANASSNWVDEFKAVALTMGPNELYPELVLSQYGYHILRSGDQVSADEADYQEFLKQQALYDKRDATIENWLEELKADATIIDQRSPAETVS